MTWRLIGVQSYWFLALALAQTIIDTQLAYLGSFFQYRAPRRSLSTSLRRSATITTTSALPEPNSPDDLYAADLYAYWLGLSWISCLTS